MDIGIRYFLTSTVGLLFNSGSTIVSSSTLSSATSRVSTTEYIIGFNLTTHTM